MIEQVSREKKSPATQINCKFLLHGMGTVSAKEMSYMMMSTRALRKFSRSLRGVWKAAVAEVARCPADVAPPAAAAAPPAPCSAPFLRPARRARFASPATKPRRMEQEC